jgi:hypothetical protein
LGIIRDLANGLIAVIGVVIGRIIGDAFDGVFYFRYFPIILAIIGLIITGAGLKRRGIVGAFVTGFGLGLATPIVGLI